MTEQEIKELEAEVLAGESVPKDFEITHLEMILAGYKAEAQRVQCNFRIFKYVRDDERMQGCKKDIKKLRDAIEGVEKRLQEIQAV